MSHRKGQAAKPTTAIQVALNGEPKTKTMGIRPWSEGVSKQFGLGEIVATGDYAIYDKIERQEQAEVLLDFYESHSGDNWTWHHGWAEGLTTRRSVGCSSVSPGTLGGVSMAPDATHVEALELPKNDVPGLLDAPFFVHMEHLRVLRLQGNRFKGNIPASIGKYCMALEELDLSTNRFTGPLPVTFDDLPALQVLRLMNNALTGPLPAWDRSRHCLRVLNLCNNKLSGSLDAITNMAKEPPAPEEVVVNGKILKRENAESLGAWARKSDSPWPCLEELSLGQNHFKGDCSALLCASWPCLISLSMPNNGLQGCFAAQDAKNGKCAFQGCERLEYLFLDHNKFTGPLTETLMQMTSLKVLSLSDNQLTGPVPPTIGLLTQLHDLWLSHNALSGVLPVHMGDDSDSEEEEEEDELDYGMPTSDSIDDFVSTANSTSVGGKISTYTGGSSSGSTHSSSSSSSSQNGSSSSQSRGHDGSFISHGFSFSTAGEAAKHARMRRKAPPSGGGFSRLRGSLKVLGLFGNVFHPDPAYEVSVLGLEHHDLPQPTTNADVSSLLLSIGAPISASQPLPSGARSASGGGGSVTSSSNSLGSGPGRGMKSVTALPRDYYSKATAGELYRSGEEAIKVAEGDKNWRDMQSRMHQLHEAAAAQQVASQAELEARQWATAQRLKLKEARLAKAQVQEVQKAQRRKEIRDANTSGPRIMQQLVDAQAARKERLLEEARRRKELFG